jgi:hypothetical protein
MTEKDIELDACGNYYQQLYQKSGVVLRLSFENDKMGIHSRAHGFSADLDQWIKALGSRPETELLISASGEYQFALLSLVTGNYRQAFMGLRVFLELVLAGVYFSTRELDLRLILAGKMDVHWATIIDPDSGLFSKTFAEVFFDDLADESPAYRSICEKLYRECSEFIHGNRSSFEDYKPVIEFQPELFQLWHDKARNCRLAISFVFCLRYLKFISRDNIVAIEAHVMEDVGHLGSIREFFGGAR